MVTAKEVPPAGPGALRKTPTGIRGIEDITRGGLPTGRPTLVCGGAGCGKTLFAMEFLVRGALEFGEPGVFVSFEETAEDLVANVASLGFDLAALVADKKIVIDHVRVERAEIEEAGEYDLEGLFVRLGYAIDSIGASRVVLDSVEALFGSLPNPAIIRAELRRLFRWFKSREMTTVVTGERGEATLTRFGIEEYVSDCVIVLDHRVSEQLSTRRLRVAKYRGSLHGANEYPFLIDARGISVLPVTSLGLDHDVSTERVPTGVERLDVMLGGQGYFRGSSVLVSGTAGSGKTSLAAHFADATCSRGERCLTFLFEESPGQLLRNMRSIGIDLQHWVDDGVLRLHAARPSLSGLEAHLAVMLTEIEDFEPHVVIIDPISSFSGAGHAYEVKAMLLRLVDYLKAKGITLLMINLSSSSDLEHTDIEISSLIDTWLLLRDIETDGERNRGLFVLKSRGMAHSNQIREFRLTDHGVELTEVYLGAEGMLTGSARKQMEARDTAERLALEEDVAQRKAVMERRRQALENQIELLRAQFADEEAAALASLRQAEVRAADLAASRGLMSTARRAGTAAAPADEPGRRNDGDQP